MQDMWMRNTPKEQRFIHTLFKRIIRAIDKLLTITQLTTCARTKKRVIHMGGGVRICRAQLDELLRQTVSDSL
jgi:hypothetical protein